MSNKPQDTSSYVVIEPSPDLLAVDAKQVPGAIVTTHNSVRSDRVGQVVGHGRSQRAHREYTENVATAARSGRSLTSDDFEPLMDSEGPLVRFPGQDEIEWFPGQAITVLRMATSDERRHFNVLRNVTDVQAARIV